MAVVIRLQRIGKPKQPNYRVVAVEKSRGPRGKPLEVLGSYNPRGETAAKKITLKRDRFDHWVKNGALPSGTVAQLAQSLAKTTRA